METIKRSLMYELLGSLIRHYGGLTGISLQHYFVCGPEVEAGNPNLVWSSTMYQCGNNATTQVDIDQEELALLTSELSDKCSFDRCLLLLSPEFPLIVNYKVDYCVVRSGRSGREITVTLGIIPKVPFIPNEQSES